MGADGQAGFFKQAGAIVSAAYTATMKGGELQAAFRQGLGELGEALKAFPDSIQVDEPGSVFNPLYSDIAADKRAHHGSDALSKGKPATPGEIAHGAARGSVHGESHPHQPDKPPLPSPSEIAKEQPQRPDSGHGQEHGQDHGRGM